MNLMCLVRHYFIIIDKSLGLNTISILVSIKKMLIKNTQYHKIN